MIDLIARSTLRYKQLIDCDAEVWLGRRLVRKAMLQQPPVTSCATRLVLLRLQYRWPCSCKRYHGDSVWSLHTRSDIVLKSFFTGVLRQCGGIQDVYRQAVKKQQDTVESILKKAHHKEELMRIENDKRQKELARKKLHRQLNMEYRMECVDTSRKQQLYQREQLLHKIEAETERVLSMQCSRAALQMQRKEANMQAALQRQKMVERMDRLQQAKKFDKIASGQVSIESLLR
jgi:hypothetical protein